MSGISGFCNYNRNYLTEELKWQTILTSMKESLLHRGFANQAQYLNKHVCMAMGAQEAISDQTNTLKTGEENAFILFDGAVLNPEELPKGIHDAQRVLKLILKEDIGAIHKINGGFAGAFYSDYNKKLYLFRDPIGIKPLFYTIKNDTLVFASEIKGILKYPEIQPIIDKEGLGEVFGLGPARYEQSGVFQNIHSLPPGHIAVFDEMGLRQIEYWGLKAEPHKETFLETADHVAYLLKDAVKRQMRGVGDICAFLSGGVDSSLVTAIAAKEINCPLKTVSFDFMDNDKNFVSNLFQPEQDRPYVEQMVSYCQTDHDFLFCDTADLMQYLEKAVIARDLPGMCDVDASLLYFCTEVSQKHKTALSGECADEIFAGYPWFHRPELYHKAGFPWSNNIEARTVLLKEEITKQLQLDSVINQYYLKTQQITPLLDGETAEEEKMRQISFLTIKWFMATLGDRMDRMSAQAGMDVRMPFADHRLVSYLYNVPFQYKTKDGTVKGLLRESFKDYLPENLLYRKKSPYPKTYNPEYEKQLRIKLLDLLNNQKSPIASLIDLEKTEKFILTPSDYGKPWYGQLMAGPQMLAYMIQVNYWIEHYHITLKI